MFSPFAISEKAIYNPAVQITMCIRPANRQTPGKMFRARYRNAARSGPALQNSSKDKKMEFQELGIAQRYPGNPVLTKKEIPYEAELVFNAGVCKFNGKYVMCFRNDYGSTQADFATGKGRLKTNIGLAFSNDGIHWIAAEKPCFTLEQDGISRAYDPRLTVIDGRCYLCFAVDGDAGVCGGIAVTDDFDKFEILYLSEPDNRNMVLFPEKHNGCFLRLDRPFPVYGKGGGEAFDAWLSVSPDCRYWGGHRRILKGTDIPFCNSKTGPAAPPVKTFAGWLTTFHAVWKLDKPDLYGWEPWGWGKIYTAGIMLLDSENPAEILGIAEQPLLAPVTEYEKTGFRGSTIFPGGMILEDSGEVKLYYGAGDAVECLATADVGELINACLKKH